jgi:uncharacterized protein YbaA (DUF1428 family)
MAEYVDGFVLAIPKKNIDAYKKMAKVAAKVWKEHGAIDYRECIADDVPYGKTTSFPRSVDRKNSETVVFAWITYKSRAQRDKINKAVLKDPRIEKVIEETGDVMDPSRMLCGGFETIVKL